MLLLKSNGRDKLVQEPQLLQGIPKAADAHYSTSEKRGVNAGDGFTNCTSFMTSSSLSQLPYHPLLKEAQQMKESLNETQGLQAKLNRQEKATSFLFYAFAISLSAAFIF